MRNFLDTYCTKDQLERYGLFATIVGAISVFFGVIYQYTALSYGELSFFSWTQAVNDGVKIVPILVFLSLGVYLGFKVIIILSNLELYKRKLIGDLGLTSLVLIGLWIVFILCFKEFNNLFKDNLWGTLAIGIDFFIVTILLILTSHSLFALFFRPDRVLGNWINGSMRSFLIPLLLVSAVYCTITFLKSGVDTIDSHNCVSYEGGLYGIKYLNDKYIFTKKGLIFENKDRVFIKNIASCEDADKIMTRFIKKDGKCIELRSFDDQHFEYLETASGFIKNNGYDLYLSGSCIPDGITKK